MTTEEINIISHPGHQLWPDLVTRLDIKWTDQARSKFQNSAWPGWPPGAYEAVGQAGSSDLYYVVKMNEYSVLSRSKKMFLLLTCTESL
jgi:hypothetical protein